MPIQPRMSAVLSLLALRPCLSNSLFVPPSRRRHPICVFYLAVRPLACQTLVLQPTGCPSSLPTAFPPSPFGSLLSVSLWSSVAVVSLSFSLHLQSLGPCFYTTDLSHVSTIVVDTKRLVNPKYFWLLSKSITSTNPLKRAHVPHNLFAYTPFRRLSSQNRGKRQAIFGHMPSNTEY
jgi:hypothetical protein